MYTGPIVFIVHSPFVGEWAYTNFPLFQSPESKIETNAMLDHAKKILKLIKFAKKHDLPVVYGHQEHIEPWFKDIVKDAIKVDLSGPATDWEKKIKKGLETHQINPSKVIIGGHYTELCVKIVENRLRLLFPTARIIELRQNYTASHCIGKGFACSEDRVESKNEKKEQKVERRPLARKLLRL